MYKQEFKHLWHVFTDGRDEWVKTLREAKEIVKVWKAEGFTDIRIYKETEWNKEEGLFTREDVVYSVGSFPG